MIGSLPTRTLPLYTHRGPSIRNWLAAMLRSASRILARVARQLKVAERNRGYAHGEQVFEFYAEAGAPEGALYVDGAYVGKLPGITRL